MLLMAVSLAIGAVLLARQKGAPRRRRWGRIFVAAVLLSNILVFSIYEGSATPGVFHLLAVVSLLSVLAALV